MKKHILTFLVILCAVPIMAQDYNSYLQSAQNKFDLGDYENAQKALKIYVEMTGQSETNLSERITTAIKLLKNAQISTDDQKYAHAITLYKQVLSINPKDPNVQNKINKLQAIINNSHKANQATQSIERETSLTISNKYNIGDYYQDNKGNRGIIYELDEANEHGKIVSLNDVASDVKFSYKNRIKELVNTSSYRDAAHNHTLIKRIDKWHKIFIGFKRCEEYGYGWKLPAVNDLILILTTPAVRNALIKYGGGLVPGSYMSSTYSFNKYDFIFNEGFYYDGIDARLELFLADDKIEHVRAIYEF